MEATFEELRAMLIEDATKKIDAMIDATRPLRLHQFLARRKCLEPAVTGVLDDAEECEPVGFTYATWSLIERHMTEGEGGVH